jgi:hypothetical protein
MSILPIRPWRISTQAKGVPAKRLAEAVQYRSLNRTYWRD